MITRRFLAAGLLFALAPGVLRAADDQSPHADKRQARRAAIDTMAADALAAAVAESAQVRALEERSVAYAVFDNVKVALLVSGGGGVGVAVDKATGARTYMKMGMAGIGLGLGGQSYQVVFFFETADAFHKFVEKGWQADTQAQAAAGTAGANVGASFRDGVAVVQITNKGLIAAADITGTRVWKDKFLN